MLCYSCDVNVHPESWEPRAACLVLTGNPGAAFGCLQPVNLDAAVAHAREAGFPEGLHAHRVHTAELCRLRVPELSASV